MNKKIIKNLLEEDIKGNQDQNNLYKAIVAKSWKLHDHKAKQFHMSMLEQRCAQYNHHHQEQELANQMISQTSRIHHDPVIDVVVISLLINFKFHPSQQQQKA
jgi:hypothetical protein